MYISKITNIETLGCHKICLFPIAFSVLYLFFDVILVSEWVCVCRDSKSSCTFDRAFPQVQDIQSTSLKTDMQNAFHRFRMYGGGDSSVLQCAFCLLSNPIFNAISQAHLPRSKCKASAIIFALESNVSFTHLLFVSRLQTKEHKFFPFIYFMFGSFLFSTCYMHTTRIPKNDVLTLRKLS